MFQYNYFINNLLIKIYIYLFLTESFIFSTQTLGVKF